MESRERLTRGGVGVGEGSVRRRRARLLLIVLPVFSLWGGARREGGRCVRNEGQGSPHGQQLKPRAPLRTTPTSLQWAAHWSRWISDWHTEPVATTNTPSDPSPSNKHNNASRADWNSKASLDATGIDSDGQKGGGSCDSLGSYKNRC